MAAFPLITVVISGCPVVVLNPQVLFMARDMPNERLQDVRNSRGIAGRARLYGIPMVRKTTNGKERTGAGCHSGTQVEAEVEVEVEISLRFEYCEGVIFTASILLSLNLSLSLACGPAAGL
jgi:hypothetical protein